MGSTSDFDPQSVEALFSEAMHGRGYRKKALNWSIDRAPIVVILNLQTSGWNERKRWGRHYLNISCFIRELDETSAYEGKVPSEYKGHIRLRAGHLLPGDYVDNIACLDDTVPMGFEERREAIRALLEIHVLPCVDELSSAEGIRRLAAAGKLETSLVARGVVDWAESRKS